MARALEFGWRRVAAGGGAGPPPVEPPPPVEQAETTALVARMAVPPDTARRALIDALVAGLKADGVWAKLDWLCLLAAHDAQAARLNWVAAKALAAVNAPLFTVDRGYAGDGSAAYLGLGEALGAGGRYQLSDAGLGVWINGAGSGARDQMGAGTNAWAYIATFPAGQTGNADLNGAQFPNFASHGLTGHVTISRTEPGQFRRYIDGALAQTLPSGATALPANDAAILRAGSYSDSRIAAAYVGGGLTAGEAGALHGRLQAYLSTMGAA